MQLGSYLGRLWGRTASSVATGAAQRFLGKVLPPSVTLVEVGPREGLQNEAHKVPTAVKVQLIDRLAAAGLPVIEAGSFMGAQRVPQLADTSEVLRHIERRPEGRYPVIVTDMRGLDEALQAGAAEVCVFASAAEALHHRHSSLARSICQLGEVAAAARREGVAVRGYVGCALGFYPRRSSQGEVRPEDAARMAGLLHELGCYEVALADTMGAGTPASVAALFEACKVLVPVGRLAAHMHNTCGQGLANVLTALLTGVHVVDTSVAGLASSVATEDVVFMLGGFGIQHGVDMERLLDASEYICGALGRPNSSRAAAEALARRRQQQQAAG